MRKQLKDLFIPHEGNRYKPNILERVSLCVMFLLVVLSFSLANIQSIVWIASDFLVSSILPAVIVDLTNEERVEGAVSELTRSPTLDAAAQLKAEHMADNEYFAHYSPGGISPWYWFDQVSYDFLHAGENLAVHFTDSGDVVEAWMQSPTHRNNILNGNFSEIGIGTARGEYKGFPTVYVVQLFGTLRAPQVAEADNSLTLETTRNTPSDDGPVQEVAQASFETIPEENLTQPISEESKKDTSSAGAGESTSSEIAEESVVVVSDLATTSRPGVPLVVEESESGPQQPTTNLLERAATQPTLWLQVLYGVLALFVVLALLLSVIIEWRRQHPVQIAYAGALLLIMGVLLKVHLVLTTGATIV